MDPNWSAVIMRFQYYIYQSVICLIELFVRTYLSMKFRSGQTVNPFSIISLNSTMKREFPEAMVAEFYRY